MLHNFYKQLFIWNISDVGEIEAKGELDVEPAGFIKIRWRSTDVVFIFKISLGVGQEEADWLGQLKPDISKQRFII